MADTPDPFKGLSPDEWRRALRGLEGQITGMEREAAELRKEIDKGRTSLGAMFDEGRRSSGIGVAGRYPTAEEARALTGEGLTSPAVQAAEKRRAAFLEQQNQQMRLLNRAEADLVKNQEKLANYRAALPTLGAGSIERNEMENAILAAERQERKLNERIFGRQEALQASQARLATEDAIIARMRQELALAQQMIVAHEAMLRARRSYLALGPGTPGTLPVPYRGAGGLPPPRWPGGGYYGGALGPGGGGFYGAGPPDRPRLPPGPPPPLGLPAGRQPLLLGAGPTQGYVEQTRQAAEVLPKASRGAADFGSNLQRNMAILGATSREMRKFGSLTTEFISAAGRGAVTVRELGYQVTSTIGKFGGWLAAGSAVYAAFGALQAVGRGAIDTQSGIAQLQRVVQDVNADDAAEQFRDLADAFNLPIEEVSNAAFEMGKVFEDQNDALEATKAVLGAVKVGELDVLTASRYLTSIIQAFNLPASEMVNVFDQINQAQNQFGIRIEDTLAGLSKASGTFKAAGGDLSTLLALITTARRATGQTGEVIGTALARAPNFLRQANNQEILRGMGIDPGGAITDIIDQAFRKAQGMSGSRIQELAAAIFGPQYGARIGTPLLQQFDLYQKVLQDTSPEAAKGSAQRELQSVLDQTSQELQKVIVQLEILGSALAEAGALDVFGALLATLNLTLETVNGLLDVFNDLPEPIRRAVVYMAQFAGAVALARRFNVGQSFQQGSLGQRLFTRRNQEGFLYREGLLAQRTELEREAETASQSAVRRSIDVDTQRTLLATSLESQRKLLSQYGDDIALTEADQAKVIASQERVNVARAALTNAQEAELAAMARSQQILKQSVVVESQLAALKEARTAAEARALAAASGTLIPSAVGSDAARAAQLAGLRGDQIPRDLPQYSGATQQLLRTTGLRMATSADIDKINYSAKQIDTFRQRMGANIRAYGLIGAASGAANTMFTNSMMAVSDKMGAISRSGLKGAFQSFAGSMKRMGSTIFGWIGPLDIILAVGFLTYEAIKDTQERTDEVASAADQLGQTYANEAALQEALEKYRKARDEAANKTILETASGAFADVANFVLPGDPAAGPNDVQQQFADSYQRESQRLRRIRDRAQRQIRHFVDVDQAGPSLQAVYPEFIEEALARAQSRFEKGIDGAGQFIANTNVLIRWVQQADNLATERRRELLSMLRREQIDSGAINQTFANLAQLTTDDLTKLIDSYGKIVESGMGNRGDLRGFARTSLFAAATRISSPSAAERAVGYEQISNFAETLQQRAEDNFNRAMVFARSQGDIDAAYDQYEQSLDPEIAHRFAQREFRAAQSRLEQNLQAQRRIRRELASDRTGLGSALQTAGGAALEGRFADAVQTLVAYRQAREELQKQLERRKVEQRKINRELEGLEKAEDEAKKELRELREEAARQARFEDRSEYLSILSEYRQSQAPAGVPRLRIALDFINREIDRLLRRGFARNSREVLELLQTRQEKQNEIIQEGLSMIEANTQYAVAGFGEGEEIQAQRREVAGLYRQLAYMEAHTGVYSASDIRQMEADIREAEQQIAEDQEQRAEDARLALFDIGIARAEARGNEVLAAQRQLNRALYVYRHADTRQERREAFADVIRQRAARRDAVFQAQLEDIEYQADIGKLTLQQQIRAYQQLLDTAKLNRDQRRDLHRRIYQLKQEAEQEAGGFDLRVGDIKLPTIYEIRRAIQGGVNAGTNVSMQQQNNYYVSGSNADEIVAKVARKQDDAARRNKNMARSAGYV